MRDDGNLMVGCAGWSLASKDAAFFPGDGTHLERFSRVLSCVEINSSFYRPHQEKTYARWARSVPGAFRFSVKMPRSITHEHRLQRCEVPLRAFLAEISALEEKLAVILIQLPPSLALDVSVAGDFFSHLRECTDVAVACEPRHASWFTSAAARILDKANVSTVAAHPSPVGKFDPHTDTGLLYIRLHGAPQIYYSAYDDTFLARIESPMRRAHAQGKPAWCIFDNTARGAAIPNALTLQKLLKS